MQSGDDPAALGDLDDDADHLRGPIDRIVAPVVLCVQSYGGMVIIEVADHPGVVHSVYLAALWPQRGQSVLDLFGGEVADWIVARDDGTLTLTRDVERGRQVLCRDLDRERWPEFHARMDLQSEASARTRSTAPPRPHPTTYVICNHDEAVPVEAQEAWAAAADQTVRLDTAHCRSCRRPRSSRTCSRES